MCYLKKMNLCWLVKYIIIIIIQICGKKDGERGKTVFWHGGNKTIAVVESGWVE